MIHPIFSGITGHERILEVLSRTMAHPANAYLLVGSSDVGVQSVAECFAAGILAVTPSTLMAHPDFIRLTREEGARDLTVKQARELMQRVSMSSARGGRMVVLIEEADTLNEEAANALLKVVEEPRPHVTYLFIAQRSERIPGTLRSRMALLRFERRTPKRINDQDRKDIQGFLHSLYTEPVGKQLAMIESFAKYAESQEIPERAWRTQLEQAMEVNRELFSKDPKRSIEVAEGLIHAWKLVGSSLSPRFALEWCGVRHFIPPTSLPSFLEIHYL